MIRNVKALAGPLSPVGPPGVPSAGYRPDANPRGLRLRALTSLLPSRPRTSTSVLTMRQPHSFDPPLYIADDTPSHSTRKKRKAWVPILILSSLFLMTVALLLFFAFKP